MTSGVEANSIAITGGTGTATLNGDLITSGSTGISVSSNSIVRGGAITTTSGGPVTLSIGSVGTLTSTASGSISANGGFTQSGTGQVFLAGSVTTASNNILFSGPITLTGDTSISTGLSGAGNITFDGTVNGAYALSLSCGNGNLVFGGNVGNLTSLTINSANNVTAAAISAGSILQSAGGGTSQFGALTTTGVNGVNLIGTTIVFNGPLNLSGGGSLSINDAVSLTFNSGASGLVAGTFNQVGSGTTTLSSGVFAAGGMQFNGPFNVSDSGSLTTTNQPITFFSTLDGPGNLILSSGTNDILIAGNAGNLSPLGDVTVLSARNFTAQSWISNSLTQNGGTGTTLFNGPLSTAANGLSLTGTNVTFLQNVTTTNAGFIAINNSGVLSTTAGKTISSNGAFTQSGSGNVLLAGTVKTMSNLLFSGSSTITLTAPTVLDSSLGGGNVSFASTTSLLGAESLSLNSGSGDVSILCNVGTVMVPLGPFTIVNAENVTVQQLIAASITQQSCPGTSTLLGTLTSSTPAGITLVGNMFAIGPSATNITTTNGGSFTLTNSGLAEGAAPMTANIDGSFIQNGVGATAIGGMITTTHGGVSFAGPVIVGVPTTIDASANSKNITFSSTVDGFTGTETLTLAAGGGNITFSQPVGLQTALQALTINNGANLTTNSICAGSITASSLTGAALLNGAIVAAGNISLIGSAFTFDGNVMTTNGGSFSITNSGPLTVAATSAFSLAGPFTQSGMGQVMWDGSLSTTAGAISFASPLSLANATTSFSTGMGAAILFNGTVDGATNLQLSAGTGNISFGAGVGLLTPLNSLNITSGNSLSFNTNVTIANTLQTAVSGTTSFSGPLNAGSLDLAGAAFNFSNTVTSAGSIAINNSGLLTIGSLAPIMAETSFSQTGSGSVSLGSNVSTTGTLSFVSPVTLNANLTLNSNNSDLTLSGDVDGAFDLTLSAGAGNISLQGDLGDNTRLGILTITSANDIEVQAISASSLLLQQASGTCSLVGDLDTNALAGMTLVGANFISSGTVTTTNGGSFTLTNSGLATGTGASVINLDGPFLQNGTGPVNVGGTLTTNDASITYQGPVTVLLPATFTSGGGDVSFMNTVDGPQCMTITAGTGNILFDGVVGGTTPLGCLTASGATVTQNQSLQSTGALQETATASIELAGNLSTVASPITLNGNVTIMAPNVTIASGNGAIITVTGTINSTADGRRRSRGRPCARNVLRPAWR